MTQTIRWGTIAAAFAAAAAVLWSGASGWTTARAQVRPMYSMGAAGLLQQLERLQTTASALHTGAHPDDEDSPLVAALARGQHARTAYLSLTRGEGGQNILGSERYEALGVLRTEELLQARVLDGGEQLFTRAVDFGFTTSLDESQEKWGGDAVLADVVRAIRTFRPFVVIARFTGTAADGHGHHQLAGALTPIAVEAAADPERFPEQVAEGLRPWRARKLYVGERFVPEPGTEPTLQVPTGTHDPVLGRSYFEIAIHGRSQHKSQEMGRAETRGPHSSGLRLVDPPPETDGGDASVFDGIETSLAGIAALAGLPDGALAAELASAQQAVARALAEVDVRQPEAIVPYLVEGLRSVRAARAALADAGGSDLARYDADFLLAQKADEIEQALVMASGLVVDVLSDRETVTPGESLHVTVNLFVPSDSPARTGTPAVAVPPGWVAADTGPLPPEETHPYLRRFADRPTDQATFRVDVPADQPPTQPYWLEKPADEWMYRWTEAHPRGEPFAAPLVSAEVPVEIAGVSLTVVRGVQHRVSDRVEGELRRHVVVVPTVTLTVDPPLDVRPLASAGEARRITVEIASHASRPVGGTLRLAGPPDWDVSPADAEFALERPGERLGVAFTVRPPAGVEAGRHRFTAEALIEGRTLDASMQTISYPHITPHRLYAPARADLQLVDFEVAPVAVGYIMGIEDEVADALRRMGVAVTMLGPDDLAVGDLDRFDTIVVGIRASEVRPDFVANHQRLMRWVRAGGTLVVQFQHQDYVQKELAPFPGEIGSRVVDEEAPVRILEPEHPRFTFPNRIRPDDWDGWVLERNAYGFTTFDPRYTPLLESYDPWDPPHRGGELYAEIGEGRYVYTAYSWARQLPPGVPGAYRLMANLVSLGFER